MQGQLDMLSPTKKATMDWTRCLKLTTSRNSLSSWQTRLSASQANATAALTAFPTVILAATLTLIKTAAQLGHLLSKTTRFSQLPQQTKTRRRRKRLVWVAFASSTT